MRAQPALRVKKRGNDIVSSQNVKGTSLRVGPAAPLTGLCPGEVMSHSKKVTGMTVQPCLFSRRRLSAVEPTTFHVL